MQILGSVTVCLMWQRNVFFHSRRKTIKNRIFKRECVSFLTGFGHEAALRLAKTGFTVFAGCLKPEGKGANNLVEKGGERLHVVPLDVAEDTSVEQALDTVKKNMPETGMKE